MAELRKILASIENKTITEAGGSVALDILGLGVKGLSKQSAKKIIKELGEEVTVTALRTVKGKKKDVELVLRKISGEDKYQVVTQGRFAPKTPTTLSPEQVAIDVEYAIEKNKPFKLSGELQIRASSELSQQAFKDAQNMTDDQLKAAIKDSDRSPAIRREFKEILDQRKAAKTGDPELLKREAERSAKDIAGKTDADLQALYNNPTVTAAQRKAAKEELERRGIKPEAPKSAEAPKTDPDASFSERQAAANLEMARVDYKKLSDNELQTIYNGRDEVFNSWQKQAAKETLESRGIKPGVATVEPTPAPKPAEAPKTADAKTADEVLQAKQTAAAKAETEAALDAGEIKIKESDLLPYVPGETASQRLMRTLEQKPGIADKYNTLKGTKGEEGFWQYVKRRKVATLLTALTVAAIAAGVYSNTSDPEEIADPEEVDDTNPAEADAAAAKVDAAKKKAEADAANGTTDGKNQADKTTTDDKEGNKEGDGKGNSEKTDQGAETEASSALKSQIDALIAELSKSKDPAIQKRLAAVRAKLGQPNQAASTSKDNSGVAGGWYDIGRGYQRWYGSDGVDPKTGRKVKTGTTDMIPTDDRQRDKYSNMSQSELANLARKNAGAGDGKN
jgi:hypothetical protein